MVADTPERLLESVGYFEEPEPGVPQGYTGWYHTYGRSSLRSPHQAFTQGSDGPVREGVAGPFSSREAALNDLRKHIEASSAENGQAAVELTAAP